MRKFYLYAAILISLFCAGFALAAKTDFAFFSDTKGTDAVTEKMAAPAIQSQSATASANCNYTLTTTNQHDPQTKCDKPNGRLAVAVSGGTYTSIEWYKSSGVFDPASFVGFGTTISKLEAGSYTAVIKNSTTNSICIISPSVEVVDQTPNMEYEVNIINQVIGCDGQGFGALELTMLYDNSQNIHPAWYDTNGKLIPKYNNQFAAYDLVAGTYTIIVPNANSGCEGIPFVITIGQLTPPDIAGEVTNNTACVGGNGIIDLTITTEGPAPANGYNLSWTGPTSGNTSGVISTYSLQNLPGGTYQVTASDPADAACTTTATFVIQDELTYPSIALEATPNAVCLPNATNGGYDGTISLKIVDGNNQEVSDLSPYSIKWMNADSTELAANTSGTATLYSGLKDGSYLVSVTDIATGCEVQSFIDVPLTNASLSLKLDATPQTFCSGTPDGSISATASTTGSQGYTLEWYRGNDEGGTLLNITGQQAQNLAGDQNYFVKLIDNYTGCSISQSVYVPKALVTPLLSGSSTPNSICNPALTSPAVSNDGTITVTVDNAAANDTYTYVWNKAGDNGSSGTLTGGSNILELENLQEGQYTIVATNATTGCPSGELVVEVGQAKVDPALNISTKDNTACEASLLNGKLSISIMENGQTADPSGYTFEWKKDGSLFAETSHEATALDAGEYTILVTNKASGCQSTIKGIVQTVTIEPIASLAVTQDISCTQDGQLTAGVTNPETDATYTYIWYQGQTDDAAAIITGQTGSILEFDSHNERIVSDYYTVVARNEQTGCISEPVTTYLNPADPPFTIGLTVTQEPFSCDENAGVLTAWVNDGSGSGNREIDLTKYTFEWYEGRPINPDANFYSEPIIQFNGDPLAVDAGTIAGDDAITGKSLGVDYWAPATASNIETNGQTLFKVKAGDYTVVITDENGCKELQTITLAFQNAPTPFVTVKPIDQCNTLGSIEALATDDNGNALTQADYTFKLFDGQNATDQTLKSEKAGPADDSPTVFDNLIAGWYTIEVYDINNCRQFTVTEEIKQLSLEPVVSVSNKSPNLNCEGPNGSFDVTIATSADDTYTASFDISVTTSDGTNVYTQTGVAAGVYSLPATLAEDEYTILVKGNKSGGIPTGCTTTITTILGKNTALPVITASASDQTVCTPPNGSARVTQITFDSQTITAGSADWASYTFAWYASEADFNSGSPMKDGNGNAITSFEATDLAPGTYYVTASRQSTGVSDGCPSAPAIVNVKDVSTLPVIVFESTANGDCGAPNGTLQATVTTAGANANNYTFNWYVGDDTSTPFTNGTDGTITALSGNQQKLEGLLEGKYTLEVIEGLCTPVIKTFEVGSTKSQPSITGFGSPVPNSVCNYDGVNTFPNGSFTVNKVTYNGVPFSNTAVDQNFSFKLYTVDPSDPANTGVQPLRSNATASITGLAPGTYYLIAVKTTDPGIGCGQTPFVFTIEDKPVTPVLSILDFAASNACPGGTPNGTITAKIALSDGSTPAANKYAIDWYQVTANGSEALAAAVPGFTISSPNPGEILVANLPAGTYKAVARLTDYGCPVTAIQTIGQQTFDFSLNTNVVGQSGCVNGGSISIPANGITINGNAAALSEFTFRWYKKEANGTEQAISVPGNTTTLDKINYPAIAAGTYVVEAVKTTNPAAGCGPRVEVEIPYIPAMPEITLNQQRPVSGCNTASLGLLDVTVSSPIGNTLQVSWFKNSQPDGSGTWNQDPTLPVTQTLASGSQIRVEGLAEGLYQLVVKDPATNIQCETSQFFHIQEESVPAVMSASVQDAWKCEPANGELFVRLVNAEAYRQYYPGSKFNVTIVRQEDGSSQTELLDLSQSDKLFIEGLAAGTYVITYEEQEVNGLLLSGCPIEPETVILLDNSVPVEPQIEQTKAYNVCDPSLANGELTAYVLVDGIKTTEGYDFAWYEGEVDETTTAQAIHETATAGGLKAITYTVIITRQDTGCKGIAHFTIADEMIPFTPAIEQEVMLTKCDPALANAALSANVGGSTNGYTFEWFVGQADLTTPASEAFLTQATATGLRDTTYTVRVTNPATGCQGLASHTIAVDYPIVPADSSWIVAVPSTSCQNPNGSLRVGVDSLYSNYSFSWYKGAEANPDSLIATDVYLLENLAAGTYTITITSEENGCTSTAFTKEVGEDYYFPKYKINIKPSTCIEEGTATIVDIEGKIPFYEWYYEDKVEAIATNGPFSGPAGNYWLKIVSDLGCTKWVPVEINSVVDPYNAVTINGDGQNDYFHIDCIEMFPKNRVRIYNRAGTLVFETIGYDNSLNSFVGLGNRGVYFNGKELPVGTYFYHVDKGYKNEKPQTGFLELLR